MNPEQPYDPASPAPDSPMQPPQAAEPGVVVPGGVAPLPQNVPGTVLSAPMSNDAAVPAPQPGTDPAAPAPPDAATPQAQVVTNPSAANAAGKKPLGKLTKKHWLIIGGAVLLLLLLIVVLAATPHKSAAPAKSQQSNSSLTTGTSGPNPATSLSVQQSNDAIGSYINSVDKNKDFPPDALSNQSLQLN